MVRWWLDSRYFCEDDSLETGGQDLQDHDRSSDVIAGGHLSLMSRAVEWIERIDPGTHRRVKGLRLVTAYGIAALLVTLPSITQGLHGGESLGALAGGFALWRVCLGSDGSERVGPRSCPVVRSRSSGGAPDDVVSSFPGGAGLSGRGACACCWAFLVGHMKRYGVLGARIGSQLYLGQLFAFGLGPRLQT